MYLHYIITRKLIINKHLKILLKTVSISVYMTSVYIWISNESKIACLNMHKFVIVAYLYA